MTAREKPSRTVRFVYDPDHPPTMTDAQMKRLREMRDQDIDYSDIADTSNLTGWTRLGALIPPANKVALTVRYDADVIAYFKKTGQKYQTRMNAVLRAYMLAHKKQSAKSRQPAQPNRKPQRATRKSRGAKNLRARN